VLVLVLVLVLALVLGLGLRVVWWYVRTQTTWLPSS
jgi:hypothetical protein